MRIILEKEDIEKAIRNYCAVWFPANGVEEIKVVRTRAEKDLKIEVELKGEE